MSLILDSIASIQRVTKDTDNTSKEQYQTNLALSAVKCQIQPASPADTAISEGIYGQTYLCFTTESGIMTGDKVTVSGTGQVFKVRGIEDWGNPDLSPHYELTLVEFTEEKV